METGDGERLPGEIGIASQECCALEMHVLVPQSTELRQAPSRTSSAEWPPVRLRPAKRPQLHPLPAPADPRGHGGALKAGQGWRTLGVLRGDDYWW